jgi:hypothetical protein
LSKNPDEAVWAKKEPVWTGITPVVPISPDSAGRKTLRLRTFAYANPALVESSRSLSQGLRTAKRDTETISRSVSVPGLTFGRF